MVAAESQDTLYVSQPMFSPSFHSNLWKPKSLGTPRSFSVSLAATLLVGESSFRLVEAASADAASASSVAVLVLAGALEDSATA